MEAGLGAAGVEASAGSNVGGVYDAATATYVEWIGTRISPAIEAQSDLDLLDRCADEVDGIEPGGVVLDVGCGPGRVSARLAERGLRAVGVDLSADMVRTARSAHRDVPFVCGDLHSMPFADQSFAGAVAWYSIIHTEPVALVPALEEMARVLRPNGLVLIAFQAGEGTSVERDDAYGTSMTLRTFHHDPNVVMDAVQQAGLGDVEVSVRAPVHAHETTDQAMVVARLPLR